MTIDKQQENLLFTLDFANLERRYIGSILTPLEKELFRRIGELTKDEQHLDIILDKYDLNIETLDDDLEDWEKTTKDLEIDVDNLKDELKEAENKKIDLLNEIDGLQNLVYSLEQQISTLEGSF